MRLHVLNVHTVRNLQCTFCPKKFSTKMALKTHQIYHDTPLIPCPYCGMEFQENGLKRRKILINVFFECPVLIKFNFLLDVRRHELDRPESCAYCPQAFSSKPMLRTHLMLMHKDVVI